MNGEVMRGGAHAYADSTPIFRIDEAGDSYQRRHLADGTAHDVLKNFPSAAELRETLIIHGASDLEIVELEFFWCATYCVAAA